MCPRLPNCLNLRPSDHQPISASLQELNSFQLLSALSSPNIINTFTTTTSITTSRSLSSQDHLALDAFIDHLLTSGGVVHSHHHILLHSQMNSTNQTLVEGNSSSSSSSSNTIFGYPMPVDLFSAIYASAVAGGGLVGFLKAGSKPSLFAGLLFGSLLGYGTYLTSVNANDYALTFGTSSVLAAMMGFRFYKSSKFIPAGLVCAFSLAMVTRCLYRFVTTTTINGPNK